MTSAAPHARVTEDPSGTRWITVTTPSGTSVTRLPSGTPRNPVRCDDYHVTSSGDQYATTEFADGTVVQTAITPGYASSGRTSRSSTSTSTLKRGLKSIFAPTTTNTTMQDEAGMTLPYAFNDYLTDALLYWPMKVAQPTSIACRECGALAGSVCLNGIAHDVPANFRQGDAMFIATSLLLGTPSDYAVAFRRVIDCTVVALSISMNRASMLSNAHLQLAVPCPEDTCKAPRHAMCNYSVKRGFHSSRTTSAASLRDTLIQYAERITP